MNEKIIFTLIWMGALALYVIFRNLAYLLFYALPFVAFSVFLGVLLAYSFSRRGYSYRNSLYVYPLAAGFLYGVVGIPRSYPPGKFVFESPTLYNWFNSLKSSIEAGINWTWLDKFRYITGELFLPPLKYRPVVYDLPDLSATLWIALFTGVPLIYYFLTHQAERSLIAEHAAELKEKTEVEERKLQALEYLMEGLKRDARRSEFLKDKEIKRLETVVANLTEALKGKNGVGDEKGAEVQGDGVFKTDFLG